MKIPSHEEAFKIYYEMGENRSLKKLCDEHGYKEGTVNKWSSKFEWKEKIRRLEEEEYNKRLKKINRRVKNRKLDFTEEIEYVIKEWFKYARYSDKIENMDAKELKVLMDLYLLLGNKEAQTVNINSTNSTTLKMDAETANMINNLQNNITKMFNEDEEDMV